MFPGIKVTILFVNFKSIVSCGHVIIDRKEFLKWTSTYATSYLNIYVEYVIIKLFCFNNVTWETVPLFNSAGKKSR